MTFALSRYECDAFTNAHRHSTAPYAHVINRTARDIEATVDKIAKRIQACTAAILDLSQTGNNAIFLCVIETLIAHFEHPMRVIAEGVQKILTRLYADFPHHLIWQMSRSLNHRDDRGPSRRAIVSNDILHNAIKLWRNLHSGIETSPANTLGGDIDLAKYHESFKVFTRAIGEVANYKELKVQGRKRNTDDLSLKNHFPALPSAVESMRASCKFMMPTNRLFQPSLLNLERTSHREHFNHFFRHLYVENVDDTVVQMSSLQAPKRLSFLCADGTRRMILCKSSDDLRKDRLAINMANMFNQCYSGEMPKMESLRRTLKDLRADDVMEEKMRTKRRLNPLKVQTYFICPLTDHFGIIEWIPGLVPMKQLIEGEYTR